MKQYITIPAYTDNYHVICVENKKVVSDNIVAYYNLPGYTEALENQGYEKAHFVPKAKKALDEAKRAYMNAQAEYDEAIANPLEIADEEAKTVRCLEEILRPDDWDDFT